MALRSTITAGLLASLVAACGIASSEDAAAPREGAAANARDPGGPGRSAERVGGSDPSAVGGPPVGGASNAKGPAHTPTGPAGTLDTSFGAAGGATKAGTWTAPGATAPTRIARASAAAIDSQGRIVLAGSDANGGLSQYAAWRVTATGAFDPAFGVMGEWLSTTPGNPASKAKALCLDGSDRPVLTGVNLPPGEGPFAQHTWRLTAAGQVDTTFHGDGFIMWETSNGFDQDVHCASDGGVLVSGADLRTGITERLLADGSADAAFAVDGVLLSGGRPFAVDHHGRLLHSGRETLYRSTSAGEADPTWGAAGVASSIGSIRLMAVDSADRVVVFGHRPLPPKGGKPADWGAGGGYLARFTSSGVLDPSFGTDGHVFDGDMFAYALAIDSRGRLLVAGARQVPSVGPTFAVWRYLPDGGVDTSFGAGGVYEARTIAGVEVGIASALAVDGFDRPVLATTATASADSSELMVLRLNP